MNKYDDNFWSVLWKYLPGILKTLSVLAIIATIFNGTNLISSGSRVTEEGKFPIAMQKSYNQTIGNMDSKVKMMYFVDYQCPACKGNNPTMQSIKKDYAEKVGFIYKHFPLETIHPYAKNAARSVQAAGKQGKFFEFGDKIFENQEKGLSNSTMEQIAKELGLDMEKFNADRNSKAIADIVANDYDDLRDASLPQSAAGKTKTSGDLKEIGTPISIIYKDNQPIDWWTGGLPQDQVKAKLDKALE